MGASAKGTRLATARRANHRAASAALVGLPCIHWDLVPGVGWPSPGTRRDGGDGDNNRGKWRNGQQKRKGGLTAKVEDEDVEAECVEKKIPQMLCQERRRMKLREELRKLQGGWVGRINGNGRECRSSKFISGSESASSYSTCILDRVHGFDKGNKREREKLILEEKLIFSPTDNSHSVSLHTLNTLNICPYCD